MQHLKEHGPATHKWLYVRYIFPITKVSWKLSIQLFNELPLTTNPFDKRFCFCHSMLIYVSTELD